MCVFMSGVPSYAESYTMFALMRIFRTAEQREFFLSGNLYMRSQTDFQKEEMGDGVYDYTEGAQFLVHPANERTYPELKLVQDDSKNWYMQAIEHETKPTDYIAPFFESFDPIAEYRNIFCMSTIWLDPESGATLKPKLDMVRQFGAYSVIITNPEDFLIRVNKAKESNPSVSSVGFGFVDYVDKNVSHWNQYIKPAPKYSGQNEFRICAETSDKNLLVYQMGSRLDDITVPFDTEFFLTHINFHKR